MANPIIEALQELFTNTPQGGQGLLSPKNIAEAFTPDIKIPIATPRQMGENLRTAGEFIGGIPGGMRQIPGAFAKGVGALTDFAMTSPTVAGVSSGLMGLPEGAEDLIVQKAMQNLAAMGQGQQVPTAPFPSLPQFSQKVTQSEEKQFPPEEKPEDIPLTETGEVVQEEKQAETASKQKLDPMRLLLELGIPAATATLGATVPGVLPGAAGFQHGYTQEQLRQRLGREEEAATAQQRELESLKTYVDIEKTMEDIRKSKEGKDLRVTTNAELLKFLTKTDWLNKDLNKTKKAFLNEIISTFKKPPHVPDEAWSAASAVEKADFIKDQIDRGR